MLENVTVLERRGKDMHFFSEIHELIVRHCKAVFEV